MIGTVVVCHGKIGLEMVRIAQSIVRDASPMVAVAIEHDEDVNRTRHKISDAIRQVQQEGGVILMTDMFGGTPSNLCLSFLEGKKVEVIAGVNLPMLIKLASYKENKPLAEIATFIQSYGQKNITLAGPILEGS